MCISDENGPRQAHSVLAFKKQMNCSSSADNMEDTVSPDAGRMVLGQPVF
jgi:hypothetical protein